MPHLTLAQVYAAMAYYLDHQQEVDTLASELDRRAEQILSEQPPGPSREELLARRPKGRSRASVG